MNSLLKLSILILIAVHSVTAIAQSKVNVSLEPNSTAPQISKHIYGHFAEHLGVVSTVGFMLGRIAKFPI